MQPQITLDIIFQIYKRNFTVRKRDVIPCVMVLWHISFVWHIIFPLIAKFFDVVSHIFKLKRFNSFKLLAPFTSLNWILKVWCWLNWGVLSGESRNHNHTIEVINSFRFCVSLVTLYSYLWYSFFFVVSSKEI